MVHPSEREVGHPIGIERAFVVVACAHDYVAAVEPELGVLTKRRSSYDHANRAGEQFRVFILVEQPQLDQPGYTIT